MLRTVTLFKHVGMVREILVWPHPTLKKKAEKVAVVDDSVRALIKDLFERGQGVSLDEHVNVRKRGGHSLRQRCVAGTGLERVHPHHLVCDPGQACHLLGERFP